VIALSFERFYAEVHHRAPFPWQCRLADDVLDRGWSDLVLDLPTGTGKTSVLDVALYCLARAPDRMPRRTLLVVDRRIVVDQGAEHARSLRRALDRAETPAAKHVADALRAMCGAAADDPTFAVAVMRGGMPRDNDWARRPDQPVVGVSTVDQVGSRLLFRGYGINRRSAPIHAGLIGNDTLILLDEVHLAVPFAQTLAAIRGRFRTARDGLPDRFEVVSMSATVTETAAGARRFVLDAADLGHPVLERRLSATKLAVLVDVKVTGDDESEKRRTLAERAAQHAVALQSKGARVVGIVVNRVETARVALGILRERYPNTDAILVTGRMRPIDRDRIVRDRLLPGAGAGRVRDDDARLVVVATQCIEAGADLDFDALVTEVASLDALRQRFGRVDRRGERGQTSSVILGRSDLVRDDADDPVYGRALAKTWSWLTSIAESKTVDFGIQRLPAAVDENGKARSDVVARSADAPIMLPAHVDAWAQTSIDVMHDPEVSMWLHGPEREGADVQVVWRALAEGADPDAILEVLDAVRPSTLEAVSVPIRAARDWLADRSIDDISDAGATIAIEEKRRRNEKMETSVLCWRGDDTTYVPIKDLRPGDIVIVEAGRGGIRDDSFDPNSTDPVRDVGDLGQLRGRGRPTLRLDRAALALWAFNEMVLETMPVLGEDETLSELAARAREWVETWPAEPPGSVTAAEWKVMRSSLSGARVHTGADELIG